MGGFKASRVLAAVLACVVLGGASAAEDNGALPTVATLGCRDCQYPKAIDKHTAGYPGLNPAFYPTEALVILRTTVSKDGTVKDAQVVRLIGAEIFAKDAIETTKGWKYQPGTRGGVAVDWPNWTIVVRYTYQPPETSARESVYHAFREASGLSGDGKHTEAIAALLAILATPHLNFYEWEIVYLQLAIEYAHLGDALTAREYLDDADLIGESYLPESTRPLLWRMEALVDTKTGQWVDAVQAFRKLNAAQPVAADDPLEKMMTAVAEQMHGAKILTAAGRIPKLSAFPMWNHKLIRANIAFSNLAGKIDRIDILCGEHRIESAFSDKAEWHIPATWERCMLDVYGDPGTTFTLIEGQE